MQTALRTKDSIYTRTARFDDEQRALTEDELFDLAPSIFATEGHESRSDRFQAIPTIDVLRKIAEEGFFPVGARQSTARDPVKALYTKHMIRLRKLDGSVKKVGDSVFELMLKNANDGTARYNLMGGLWRIRCANSLVAHEKTLEEIAVRHTGDAAMGVLEASIKLLDQSDRVLASAERWGRIDMEEPERLAFATRAHLMRFEGKAYGVASAVGPGRLLEAHRAGDKGTDLWTTFNVVQENIIKGGLEGDGVDGKGKACRYKSRPVKSIDADVTMNTKLWGLADEWATQHGVLV